MNKHNDSFFKDITSHAQSFKTDVAIAVRKYQHDKQEAVRVASQYKDEQSVLDDLLSKAKREARRNIEASQLAYKTAIESTIPALYQAFENDITTRPDEQFVRTLQIYRDFGIQMNREDVRALITLNKGTTLGHRAINACLESQGSKLRLSVPVSSDYSEDLDNLQKYADAENIPVPDELVGELVDIFTEQPHVVNVGGVSMPVEPIRKYTAPQLLSMSYDFDTQINSINEMSKRWTQTMLPSVEEIVESVEDGKDVIAKLREAQGEAVRTVQIENDENEQEEIARAIAKQRREASEHASEVMETWANQ